MGMKSSRSSSTKKQRHSHWRICEGKIFWDLLCGLLNKVITCTSLVILRRWAVYLVQYYWSDISLRRFWAIAEMSSVGGMSVSAGTGAAGLLPVSLLTGWGCSPNSSSKFLPASSQHLLTKFWNSSFLCWFLSNTQTVVPHFGMYVYSLFC